MRSCIDGDTLARWTLRLCAITMLTLAGCSTTRAPLSASASVEAGNHPARIVPEREGSRRAPELPAAGSGRGGYYQDDGPGDAPPAGLQSIPDAEPKIEPYSLRGNKPYVVFGKTYTPITDNIPLKQRGIGSWYGKKFHGQKTSSGEPYDMYKMTAAHPTLPIPSYARVTNLRNGIQVIVRVNDRGPFHSSRIIDLSYTAALKLGYLAHGSSELEVERLLPEEIARINSGARRAEKVVITLAPAAPVVALVAPLKLPAASLSIDEFLKDRDIVAIDVEPVRRQALPALLLVNPSGTADNAAVQVATNADPVSLLPVAVSATGLTLIPGVQSPVEPAAPIPTSGGFYLQFGAFAQSTNAEAWRQQLALQWPLSVPALEVRQAGTIYRLYSGPFSTRNEAAAASRSLPDNPAVKPIIVQR